MIAIEPIGYEVKPYGDYIIHFQDDEGERNVSVTPDRLLLKGKVIETIREMAKGK